jgi:hypothetical protein
MTEKEPIVCLYTSDDAPKDMEAFKVFIKKIGKDVWNDIYLTNTHTLGKSAKFGAGLLAASYFAKETGTLTPTAWALRRFGPLPLEFTKSGSLQILTYTTFQRFLLVAGVTVSKFVFVTFIFEGGVAIGAVTNQFLSQEIKDAIGGTIYGLICEEGWKDLWRHPFGYGICFGTKGERLINY